MGEKALRPSSEFWARVTRPPSIPVRITLFKRSSGAGSPIARVAMVVRVIALLETLGFSRIGEVVGQQMKYQLDARERTGDDHAVYVFLNPDGRIWRVGKTSRGFSRVDYTRVLDGRGMARPHEQRKLESIRRELKDGATQWVLPTTDAGLLEDLLIVILNPTESRRARSRRERLIRLASDR